VWLALLLMLLLLLLLLLRRRLLLLRLLLWLLLLLRLLLLLLLLVSGRARLRLIDDGFVSHELVQFFCRMVLVKARPPTTKTRLSYCFSLLTRAMKSRRR